ncbi:MAG: DoxX family protein [Terrimicrobiaceae bacterium]
MKNLIYKLVSTTPSYALLVARLTLGLVMFPHGAQKVLGWFGGYGFSGTLGFFTGTLHVPALLAVLVILGEFLGSLGLIVGAFSRIAALGFVAIMARAIAMVHLGNGFFMNWSGSQKGEGFEYHLLVIGLSFVIAIAGSGKFSIDALLAKASRD